MTEHSYQAPYSDQKNWSNTYLTDPRLIELLGPFDTDPCVPTDMPWSTAKIMYNEVDDGLKQEWRGRVFMNPPYRGVMKWAEKFSKHGEGIALLNGRATETKATQLIMNNSNSIWFPEGRLAFYKTNGEPWPQKWFPSLLIGMTKHDTGMFNLAAKWLGGQVYIK